jgi:hypothetical protein
MEASTGVGWRRPFRGVFTQHWRLGSPSSPMIRNARENEKEKKQKKERKTKK